MNLIGRDRELRALREQWARVQNGHANVALVMGEPGIGKTSLLDAMAHECTAHGALVLRGHASDEAAMPAYLPFLEALGVHIRAMPIETLRAQVGDDATTLVALFPELAQRLNLSDAAASIPIPHDQAKLRLFEAITRFIEETSLRLLI